MHFKVATLFNIFHLITAHYGSKCCESLNGKISAGNNADILKTLDLLVVSIENMRLSIEMLNKNMQKQLSELNKTICTKPEEPTTTETITTTETTTQPTTQLLPKNCAEALERNGKNGVYEIVIPNSSLGPFKAHCLKTDTNMVDKSIQGSWLVIQRRQNGDVGFFRDWNMYQRGFGDLEGEFFIGLDKLHALTQSKLHELWIQMKDYEGGQRWAKYSGFIIGGETESYALKSLGTCSGDAEDGLVNNTGAKWSTRDKDNDVKEISCAHLCKGAWWYSYAEKKTKKFCSDSNLNGLYLNGKQDEGIKTIFEDLEYFPGVNWRYWRGYLHIFDEICSYGNTSCAMRRIVIST